MGWCCCHSVTVLFPLRNVRFRPDKIGTIMLKILWCWFNQLINNHSVSFDRMYRIYWFGWICITSDGRFQHNGKAYIWWNIRCPKFLNVNEKALEWIDHPFSRGMFRLQFDNDNNRRGKNVNDINDSKEKTLTNDDRQKDDEADDAHPCCSLGGWCH